MRIAVIGSGHIGGVLGKLWTQAGHKVFFSSPHPEKLDELVKEAGPNASGGSIDEALDLGDVVLLSIPYGALPEFGQRYGKKLAGKVVIETGNPYPERDGEVAKRVLESGEGTGVWSARWLPGARLVRGFNSVYFRTLESEAHRPPPRVGVPLASDDPEAMEIAAQLVRDAGFDPVVVGGLERAREFDVGTPVYASDMTGPEVRAALGLQAG